MSAVVSNTFTSDCVQLVAESGDGHKVTQAIADGESVLVGSDDQCRMRLCDTSVSPKHCLVRFQNSEVTLQDWCSENGTHLNGEPIDGIAIISPDDRVQLGIYRLTFSLSKSATPASPTPATLESDTTERVRQGDSPANVVAFAESSNPDTENRLGDAPAYATSSKPRTEDKLASAGSAGPAQESFSPPAPPAQKLAAKSRTMKSPAAAIVSRRDPTENRSVEQNTIDLMKSEIELLQAELSEKDAQLSQLSEDHKESLVHDPQASNPDLERRIEQLLVELDQSDQRVAGLEEIAHFGEESQLAEAEEKRQLEAWVDDIEKRIAEREAESQAECKVLQKRLERAAEERGHLQQQVEQLAQSDGNGNSALEEMVQTLRQEVQALRQENESLCEKVAARDATYEQQKKRCQELERQTTGGVEYIQQNVDEATRAEHLLLAQERAALSRQQLEISNKVHELTREVERENRVHPADDRFRVFRQELKELEKTERVAPTVSQRLARLWQRLDGPTDRD